ncbi:DUF3467 domain-containing protein [Mucisphaera sp.]|uniref:DUF3467 domain-containing protein n=1 Tax=Mucisphaera sp. TaxID=2913024 RepID=UPI003D0DC218
MAKSSTPEKNEEVAAPEQQGQQLQLKIDDAEAPSYYASTARVSGTAEEIVVDLSRGLQPGSGQGQATMKIDARVILSPWAAKRLAMALGQAVTRYEQAYGQLEIDPRKRLQGGGKNG